MYQSPQLVQDGTDRYKLKVSLPGGRYQLSLDDRAVNVLRNDLGLEVRDTVPDAYIPFFVAFGDAWFPREKDTESILADLPEGKGLTDAQRNSLITYVTGALVPEKNEALVMGVLDSSPISDSVDPSDIEIKELPSIPDGIDLTGPKEASGSDEDSNQSVTEHSTTTDSVPDSGDTETQEPAVESSSLDSEAVSELQQIPGIGPKRAKTLVKGGIISLSELAECRPVELAHISGVTEGIGAVAVEGARELVGEIRPMEQRLEDTTGQDSDLFEPILASLATAGIPASEADSTLQVLYGPTVADIDAVSGAQAYFLWEAGYQTPDDIIDASLEELQNVYQIGKASAPKIKNSAQQLIDNLC